MSVNINADTTNGLVLTSDTSGEIKLQGAGTDIVSVTANGMAVDTNTLYVDATNHNVGIGTTSPDGRFDVSFSTDGDGIFLNNTFRGGQFLLSTIGAFAEDFSLRRKNTSGVYDRLLRAGTSQFTIFTGDTTSVTERMRIDSSGNVGIGTTSPYQAKLDVQGINGVAQYAGSNSNLDQILIGSVNRGVTPAFSFLPTGSSFVGSIGNGVNTTLGISTFGAAPVVFGTSNTERMRIDSSGNVGIGTTSPAQKLDVSGTVNATAFIGDGSALTNITDTVAPTRHSIQPSLNLDFANSKKLDPRITFTRASNATYYDGYTSVKAEENLIVNSDTTFIQSDWYGGGSDVTKTDSGLTDVKGTSNAVEVTTSSSVKTNIKVYLQINNLVANVKYTYSVWVKGSVGGETGTIEIVNANSDTSVASSSITLTTDWQRVSVTGIPTSSGLRPVLYIANAVYYVCFPQLEQRDSLTAYTPTTSSPITKYQPALQTAGNNVARFDHDPITSESLGLLIEEQRTNLFTYSSEFDNAAWAKTNMSVTANTTIAPNGTLTADTITSLADLNAGVNQSQLFTNGVTYTTSAYVKYIDNPWCRVNINNNGGAWINIETGQVGTVASYAVSATITPVGNSWYRIAVTFNGLGASWFVGFSLAVGDGNTTEPVNKSMFLWGAQLEVGSFSTSYIKTTGSQVTRSADDAEMLNIDQDDWLKQGAGTLYGEFSKPYVGETNGVPSYASAFALTNDQFDTNAISVYVEQDITPRILTDILFSNSSQYNVNIISPAVANTYYKTAIAYERNNVDSSGDGSDETTDTSAEIPFINRLRIFKRVRYQSNGNYATIKKLSYYPTKLTKNEVIDLTEE